MRTWWVVALSACSFEHGVAPSPTVDAPPAIDTGDSGPNEWSAPVEITELTSGLGEDDPSLTADLLEIYFGSRRTGGQGFEDIWRATRSSKDAAWGTPENVAALNSSGSETTAKITPNGLAIYFTSTRFGDADIFFSSRDTRQSAWSTPVIVASLSTSAGDYAAYARDELLHVVWCMGASVADEALFTATRTATTNVWSNTTKLAELDESDVSECDPMEPHTRALYYASNRAGLYDIYRVSRPGDAGTYEGREEITAVDTATSNDRDPWVTGDERLMIFASDRSGVDRLYLSTR